MAFGKRAVLPDSADLRRDPRRAVTIRATARTIDGAPVDIEIADLSAGGFRAAMPIMVREGMLLRVRLPNGRSPHARVVRVGGDNVGCEFVAPLDAEILRSLFVG